MLDAFGKGASDDIRQAKSLVYEAMTHDPDKGPPPPSTLTSTGLAPDNSSEPGPTPHPGPSLSAGAGVPGGVEGGVAGKPESPLALLRRLVELLKVLVAQLRELCVQEGLNSRQASGAAAGSGPPSAPSGPSLPPLGAGGGPQRYSSVSHGPAEWRLDPGRPCSGERMLLMYDRWQKLLKSVWNEKKGKFDISKVPDIYDSAKYDAIHNSHLGLDLQELYQVARQLARAVIPSEYGTDPLSRLRIGSKIASELLGKLLVDLAAMREESQVTQDQDDACSLADSCMLAPALAGLVLPHPPLTATYASASRPASPSKLLTGAAAGGAAGVEAGGEGASPAGPWGGAGQSARSSAAALVAQQAMGLGGRLEAERSLPLSSSASVTSQLGSGMLAGGGGEAGVEAQETIHRLLPEYAPHINSPLRHVRTRIYFTSESHIHSLINVLRYCHLHGLATSSGQTAAGSDSSSSGPAPHPGAPLLPPSACTALDGCQELDYLTHLVLRLYENKTVPFGAPERFRVEMLFSPGANYDPFEVAAQAQAAQAAAATAATSQPSPPAAARPHNPSGGAGAAAGEQAGAAAAAGATDCQLLGALAAAGTGVSDATATPASTAAAAPAGLPGLDPGPPAGGAASEAAGVVSGSRPSPSQPGPAHPLPTDKPGGAVERGAPGAVKAGAKEGRGPGGVARGGCRGPDWHVLPVVPRVLLHEGEHGMPLAYLEDALLPMAKVSKFATPGYATTLLARNNPTLGVPRSLSRIGASGGVRDSAGSAGLISHRSHVGGSDTPLSVDSCC
ncbi:histidine phosphatase superfamily-domain-containing protein [Haematococcus lacustris]